MVQQSPRGEVGPEQHMVRAQQVDDLDWVLLGEGSYPKVLAHGLPERPRDEVVDVSRRVGDCSCASISEVSYHPEPGREQAEPGREQAERGREQARVDRSKDIC